jgi:hypothetical protein
MSSMMGMSGAQGMMDARGMLAPGPRLLEGGAIDHSWANELFEERAWDFGTVRRGERLTHSFRLTNELNQMVEIKDVRVSAGFIIARANGKQLAPGASATINVQMDTHRFSGDKTSSIYVQFAQPWQATVQLQVQADSRDNPMGMMGGMSMPADSKAQKESQAKIVELESKVDRLMEEMQLLREVLAKQGANKPSKEIRK